MKTWVGNDFPGGVEIKKGDFDLIQESLKSIMIAKVEGTSIPSR